MQPEILRKLDKLLRGGINDQPQTVYLMAAIRKLLEQQQAKQQYYYLNFHCNWALHSKLSGDVVQRVLLDFDAANTHLKAGLELHELPRPLRNDIDDLSKTSYFENELKAFLQGNGLPSIDAVRTDGWIYFLHFYATVISDCPLKISTNNAASGIVGVTVKVELANQPVHDHMMFKVIWEILDKNGLTGTLEIYDSFALNSGG